MSNPSGVPVDHHREEVGLLRPRGEGSEGEARDVVGALPTGVISSPRPAMAPLSEKSSDAAAE